MRLAAFTPVICAFALGLGERAHAVPAAQGIPTAVDSNGLGYVDRADVASAGAVGVRVDLDYVRMPLRALGITDRVGLRVLADVGLFRDRLQLSLGAGGSFLRYRQDLIGVDPSHYDIGAEDLRLYLKGVAVQGRHVAFAIAAGVNFAIGDRRHMRSDGAWGGELRFVLDGHWRYGGFVAGLGARLHGMTDVPADDRVRSYGPEILWQAALFTTPHPWVLLAAEALGSETVYPGAASVHKAVRTAEVLGTVHLRPRPTVAVGLSAGSSVALGSLRDEDFRVLVSVLWHPLSSRRDAILDRDHDGVPDDKDRCPNDPEDRDGFEDEDGCPDRDNDQDGIPDDKDKCPLDPEDRDGFEDEDGCPELDNDKDGVPDDKDRCPNQPELKDGFQDGSGCPNNDVDGDGIPNDRDACPQAPETMNGFADEDGCPDVPPPPEAPPPAKVGTVDFAPGRPNVSPDTAATLGKLADWLKAHERVHVELVGRHEKKEPPRLADERADTAARHLTTLGVPSARITVVPARKSKAPAGRAVEWRLSER